MELPHRTLVTSVGPFEVQLFTRGRNMYGLILWITVVGLAVIGGMAGVSVAAAWWGAVLGILATVVAAVLVGFCLVIFYSLLSHGDQLSVHDRSFITTITHVILFFWVISTISRPSGLPKWLQFEIPHGSALVSWTMLALLGMSYGFFVMAFPSADYLRSYCERKIGPYFNTLFSSGKKKEAELPWNRDDFLGVLQNQPQPEATWKPRVAFIVYGVVGIVGPLVCQVWYGIHAYDRPPWYVYVAAFLLFAKGMEYVLRWSHVAPNALVASDLRRPIIYLRSFNKDSKPLAEWYMLPAMLSRSLYTFERTVIGHVRRFGPVLALGRPGQRLPNWGASRLYPKSQDWPEVVGTLVSHAALTIVNPDDTPGVAEEFSILSRTGNLHRTIVALYPELLRKDELRRNAWERLRGVLLEKVNIEIGDYNRRSLFLVFDKANQPAFIGSVDHIENLDQARKRMKAVLVEYLESRGFVADLSANRHYFSHWAVMVLSVTSFWIGFFVNLWLTAPHHADLGDGIWNQLSKEHLDYLFIGALFSTGAFFERF